MVDTSSSSSSSESSSEPRVGASPPSGLVVLCSHEVKAPPGAMNRFQDSQCSRSSRTSGSRCAAASKHAPMCITNEWQQGSGLLLGGLGGGSALSAALAAAAVGAGAPGGAYSSTSAISRCATSASVIRALRMAVAIEGEEGRVTYAAHSSIAAVRMCSALHVCGISKRSITIGKRPRSRSGINSDGRSDLRHSSISKSSLQRCWPRGR
mmetsp:Transcript_24209/g.48437  ORF Transcript_24209/g.48437 Transcript_24209/m.48437 type:complete len:209 (+) Transcript_24209:783-1409(+)